MDATDGGGRGLCGLLAPFGMAWWCYDAPALQCHSERFGEIPCDKLPCDKLRGRNQVGKLVNRVVAGLGITR